MNSLRLRAAWLLNHLGVWLGDVEDWLLKPIVKNGLSKSLDGLKVLIRSFPPGYHRGRLRAEWQSRKRECVNDSDN